MRHVCIFTGTRAEYGLLRPVLYALRERCVLQLVASGTHVSRAHGYTLDEITTDGFTPDACVDLRLGKGATGDVCASMGHALAGIGATLERLAPDVLVVLGDRYEALAAAIAAQILGVPVAHIHGGERTEGAMDEAFRHAITKMAHLHFTACAVYRQRVIQLGENPERVWNVGALGVENVLSLPPLSEAAIRQHLRLALDQPYLLCTFHPVTLEAESGMAQLDALLEALDDLPQHAVIFTGANADPQGQRINARLADKAAQQEGRFRFFHSLGVERYISAARYAACVAGNSSSGVIEVPSLGTPVLDVGERQRGRERSSAVLWCPPDRDSILRALRLALTPEHARLAASAANPYYQPDTAATIVQHLLTEPLGGIRKKAFYTPAGDKVA